MELAETIVTGRKHLSLDFFDLDMHYTYCGIMVKLDECDELICAK